VLREFRGDGHVATLMTAGLTGLEAMVLQIAAGETDANFLYATRGWGRPQWAEAADALRSRGLIAGEQAALTDAGRQLRAELEAATDRLAMPAYAVLGEDGMLRLAELTRPLSRTLVRAGMLNPADALGGIRAGSGGGAPPRS
jgi:hypothetical protein